MGRHMLFAHTSRNGITAKPVEYLVFKSFARGDYAFSAGYDQEHNPYLLSGPLLEGVKSAKYTKR